ncbi:hypothetical protein ESY86_00440 [Subsaximicrobium wynnwilliamsii]|uniref:STAT transcription factor homologue coiled coil domain-containing protein n=1 Tax=Subsaximicrobium wynnwilliamsii TaxID=291179 RepID=A0A5C6ZNR6_9FLAO|nr:hypothetical protein [Subsaximicrobium wynnwilliamsii]TXD85054.1 hypothetical protein ESY87_01610 [Subsaximicrobium wynnwilliamsii]TXD91097.1 hypothetical protein ESY86_00440 [Subsaximicrobium wynnwilliamsii]TXE04491.1 hypothetical protein ESY88_03090 [Subsaximicrobium wynnwilliamsii]
MKTHNQPLIILSISILLFASCESVTSKVETQLNQLNDKAIQLDSVINTEMEKINQLDSVINLEDLKIKKLDSLVEKTSSKLDSIWRKHK